MRQIFGFTRSSTTCVACRRRSWPTRAGHRVRLIYAPDQHRCPCLSESAGPTRSAMSMDVAQFPLARVVAALSPAPGGSSPVADREQDGPGE